MQSTRPKNVPAHADKCLEAVVDSGFGHKISLGGAFGLLHYLDYRQTQDVDAWWHESTTPDERDAIVRIVRETLEQFGEVRVRTWGEVVSVELVRGSRKIFSFQVARRTAQLEEPRPAPWTDVLLDSFNDLVANKMVALVERGAPRDFRDVYAVCQNGLATVPECWDLWKRRLEHAGVSPDTQRARLAVQTHLARIQTQRPLTRIQDDDERAFAERARRWYKTELLDGLMD